MTYIVYTLLYISASVKITMTPKISRKWCVQIYDRKIQLAIIIFRSDKERKFSKRKIDIISQNSSDLYIVSIHMYCTLYSTTRLLILFLSWLTYWSDCDVFLYLPATFLFVLKYRNRQPGWWKWYILHSHVPKEFTIGTNFREKKQNLSGL